MVNTINPQDAKPDEVYEGTVGGKRLTLRRTPDNVYEWESFSDVHNDREVSDLVCLVPAREVTRQDLPTADEAAETYLTKGVYSAVQEGMAIVLDAVVAHLNANGGLPAEDALWRRAHSIVEQERDQARSERDDAIRMRDEAASRLAGVRDAHKRSADAHMEQKARAEAAELERDDADQRCAVAESERDRWKLHHDRVDGQWAKAEREVTQLRAMERERDEWKARADKWRAEWVAVSEDLKAARQREDLADEQWKKWEHKANEWKARAEAAEARTAPAENLERESAEFKENANRLNVPAVTRDDIEKAIHGVYAEHGNWAVTDEMTDAVWSLVSGADPAVHVVRESDIAAVEVERVDDQWNADGALMAWTGESAEEVRGQNANALRNLAHREAVARAIESAPADPLLDKAQEFAALADWELTDREAGLLHKVAAHVLGQEDRHVDQ